MELIDWLITHKLISLVTISCMK